MNRLINAEFYRIRKTYNLFFWSVALMALMAFIAASSVGFDCEDSASVCFPNFIEYFYMMVAYTAFLVGGMFVTAYENKVLNYEIMAGEKPHTIILSKFIAAVPLLTVITVALMALPSVYFGLRNGFGDEKFLVCRYLVITVVILRVFASSVFIMTSFKSVLGLAMIFARFVVFDLLYMMILAMQDLPEKTMNALSMISVCMNMNYQASSELPENLIWIIIIISVVEILLWYVLALCSYRKKWFS